jgi:predicted component of type VI protein secretion system
MLSLLGNTCLGVDTVLGDTWEDDEPAIEVKVGPVAIDRLLPFLPEGIAHKQLKIVYGFFFPAETDVITSLEVEEKEGGFLLVADEGYARLSLTTAI